MDYYFVKNKDLPRNKLLREIARENRKAGNLAEVLLWKQLKGRQLCGLDFDRQRIIGNFIVDFYCPERKVIIEVDGGSHNDKVEYDKARDEFLEAMDLKVIHITDVEVKTNMEGVIRYLENHPALRAHE